MERVDFKEIRTGQYAVVKQFIPRNPGTDRLGAIHWWAGKVVETNAKWIKGKLGSRTFVIPQEGTEEFYVMPKKDFEKFVKEFKVEDMVASD